MIYKFRVILDVSNDVFRDIIVSGDSGLEDLHLIFAKSFGFKGQEMASFYRTDGSWNQGEEIPLFDMSEDSSSNSMSKFSIKDVFKKVEDKLIYVYDFFSMWTFFVELSEISEKSDKDLPFIAISIGNPPEEAPAKNFTSEISDEGFDEDNFESFDELDFDNY